MNYADEEFYTNEYLAGRKAVITTAFPYYAREATQYIKQYTGRNIEENNAPECVKMCCCEIAELMYRDERTEAENGGVSSESVQGWSKSYESTETRKTALRNAQRECVYKWLSGTGLLCSKVKRSMRRC